jgi:hypothetical protein
LPAADERFVTEALGAVLGSSSQLARYAVRWIANLAGRPTDQYRSFAKKTARTRGKCMTLDELYSALCEAELGDKVTRQPNKLSMQDYCIERDGSVLRVGQTERNWFCSIDLETQDEAEACHFFLAGALDYVWHLTRSPDVALIERQQAILTEAGIAVERNDLPAYVAPGGISHYRIFVAGKNIRRARQLLGL